MWKYGRNLVEICEIRQKSEKSGDSSENLKFRTGCGLVSDPSVMSEGEANKLKTVLVRTKMRVQYHTGYQGELAKRYYHFGKASN